MRVLAIVGVSLCLAIPSVAFAHTSVGGGGSSSDPDADCLRWVAVPLTAADGGPADGAVDAAVDGGDAGSSDGGTTVVVTKLVCLEHATMFGCACALEMGRGEPSSAASVFLVGIGALAAVSRRRRKRRDLSGEVTP